MAQEFERSGVTDACISPGSRSTAIVTGLLRAGGIRPWVVLDERSAGFFAMGMARETRRPVMLVCTSGTAAANYTPAVVEASLSRIPLIVLTADRPPEARDCRAAQTIDQVRMFGSHARWSVDVLTPAAGIDLDAYYRTIACRAVASATQTPAGPVHLNIPMREPLVDVNEEAAALGGIGAPAQHELLRPYVRIHPARMTSRPESLHALAGEIRGCERGLIVCGPGAAPGNDRAIPALARKLNWPILADPLSGLRFGRHDRSLVIDAYDVLLRDARFCGSNQPDAVVQFGDPPVSKALGQFLAHRPPRLHLIVAEPGTWPDPLHVATDVARIDAAELCTALIGELDDVPDSSRWTSGWVTASATVRAALDETLAAEGWMFEGKVIAELMRLVPDAALVHVGNSMPVRDLDTFVGGASRDLSLACNRGANGIDGVLSTALGAAAARKGPTVLVVGDLSFIHDIGALHIAARHRIHLLVIVVNNDGGGIFSFLPQVSLGDTFETFFAAPHGLDFERAAEIGRAQYARADSWDQFASAVQRALAKPALHVLEIPGDRSRNVEMHRCMIDFALDRFRAQSHDGGAR